VRWRAARPQRAYPLAHFAWWRVIRWLRTLHRWKWKDVRQAYTTPEGRWKPVTADGIELFNLETVPVTRYRYRGSTESPVPGDGLAGFGERPGETGQEQSGYRAPGRLNRPGAGPTLRHQATYSRAKDEGTL
jgi:hypothetical protein